MRRLSPVSRFMIATVVCGVVAACATMTLPPRPVPSLNYQKYPPVPLNVAQIQVIDNYTASSQPPFIEAQMAAPLPQVVHNWAANRFQARGQDGTLVISIDKASVESDNLKRTTGFRGLVTVDQSQKLAGQIEVKFSVSNSSFGSSGMANVGVKGIRTVAENASLQQQDEILADLTESLMLELDSGTQRVFAQKLPTLMQQGGIQSFAPQGVPNNPYGKLPKSNY